MFGTKVYSLLGQPEPDPELVKNYNSFSHITGEYRSKVAHALNEVDLWLGKEKISVESSEAKAVIKVVFYKTWFKRRAIAVYIICNAIINSCNCV